MAIPRTRARYAAERTNLNLLLHILNHPDATCRRAATALGMSYPNVYRLVADFIARGILIEEKPETPPTARGRRSRLLKLRPDLGCTIGVEVEATHIRGIVLDFANEIAAVVRHPIDQGMSPEAIIQATADVAEELRWAAPHRKGRILGVGLGLPGPVLDVTRGTIRSKFQCGELTGSFSQPVHHRTGLPVTASANSNCFALGHDRFDPHDSRCLLVLLDRFGLGSAVVWNGQLFKGASEYIGDLGMVNYTSGDRPVAYGEICAGCSLLARARQAGDSRSLLELVGADPALDPVVGSWLETAVPAFAEAIFTAVALYNPDRVVIEGIFSRFPVEVRERIAAEAETRLGRIPTPMPAIRFFEGDDLMGARGAALLARDRHAPTYLKRYCTTTPSQSAEPAAEGH